MLGLNYDWKKNNTVEECISLGTPWVAKINKNLRALLKGLLTAYVNSSNTKYSLICINVHTGYCFGTPAETNIHGFSYFPLGGSANQTRGYKKKKKSNAGLAALLSACT